MIFISITFYITIGSNDGHTHALSRKFLFSLPSISPFDLMMASHVQPQAQNHKIFLAALD